MNAVANGEPPILQSAQPCILCGGRDVHTVSTRDRKRQPLMSVMCVGCGLVFNDPVPGDATVERFYRDAYRLEYKGAAIPSRRQLVRNFARVLAFFERYAHLFATPRTCLDVGCGSGEFLFFASALGMRAKGIEPNRSYAAYARDSLDLDVRTAFIQDIEFPAGGVDFIRLNHVLEHLNRPVESLEALRRWLADDGIVYVTVPNIETYAGRRSRGNIFHFGHIFNFNPWSLRACAGLAGFEELENVSEAESGSTGTFFRKGRIWTAEEARNRENAARVAEVLRRHYAERRVAGVAARMMRRLKRRAEETRTALSLSGPAAIGAHFVAQFQNGAARAADRPARG